MPELETKVYKYVYPADRLRNMSDEEMEVMFGDDISKSISNFVSMYGMSGKYKDFRSSLVPDFDEVKEDYVHHVNIFYVPNFVSIKEKIDAAKSKMQDM